MLIAQLTDLHCTGPGPAEPHHRANDASARAAVAAVLAEDPAPDLVLGTGDLTCDGAPAHLEALLDIVAPLGARFLPLPGNHDVAADLRGAFVHVPWADGAHASWVWPAGATTIIGLDSTAPGYHGGTFDAAREEWLRAVLGAADAPVLLALHHPPMTTGIAWMDLPFVGVERLAACLAEHAGTVTKIVCGHLHRPITGSFAGIPVQTGLSTAVHVALDLRPEAAPMLVAEPVGYQLHRWHRGGWVTHTRYVGTPAPFKAPWT